MDIYSILFILSTLWVGPFWFAMLLSPQKDKTKKLLDGPMFFLGPIIIWIIIMALNPQGMVEFVNSGSHPDGFLIGLAAGMSSKAGVTAMWTHMVAGDICVTRWIWQDSLNRKMNPWLYRVSIFFGVMLMPVGLVIYLIFRGKKVINKSLIHESDQ
ncbi:MAG: ABA4-like family protein [Bacteroidia bacterium]|nr:ABA4-like family protein [Bacteroidia bacterium]